MVFYILVLYIWLWMILVRLLVYCLKVFDLGNVLEMNSWKSGC